MHSLQRARRGTQLHGALVVAIFLLLLVGQHAKAFSLLGPYADWMSETNGYHQFGDIGGPMGINEEYRWNVPTITYGFDKSFLDYFGSNGVAAVESAIQILNDLPAASDIVLTNYPMDTRRVNFTAALPGLYDLKSAALALLVKQLGLNHASANILAIRTWDPALMQTATCGDENCPNLANFPGDVLRRNFDPMTLAPSFVVNDVTYGGIFSHTSMGNFVFPFPQNPDSTIDSAVAEAFGFNPGLQVGGFYTGLTRDDVGGLRYLLNATNVNWEALPKNVLFTGKQSRANKKLRGAFRPGVEKLTFVRQPQNKKGKFQALVIPYTPLLITNGIIAPQEAKRVIKDPDILFSAAEVFLQGATSPLFQTTDTTRWVNNAAENGSSTNDGPGVIEPPAHGPIKITFDTLGTQVFTGTIYPTPNVLKGSWASFDESTNPPVVYPPNTGQEKLLVRLSYGTIELNFFHEIAAPLLHVDVPYGGQAELQISTNKKDWTTLTTVTNTGALIRWVYYADKTPVFFRAVPVKP